MKKHKVILYNPRSVFFTMPLALLSIGSYLDQNKYEVLIIDGRMEKNALNTVLEQVNDALCLGITVLTGKPIKDALYISNAVRQKNKKIPIIWGGWHPSIFPVEILRDEPNVDITVQGQGDVTFSELVDRLAAKEDLKGLKGIAYRNGFEVVQNPPRDLVDINLFPAINYDLISVDTYFTSKRKKQLDYISSTGCYFRCAFCADPLVFRRKWTGLEAERIADELVWLKKRYGFTDVDFQDETFFTYRERVVHLGEKLLNYGIDTTWAATMRADQSSRLKEEDFALCAKSGLRRLLVGAETGSQEMLNWLQKDIKIKQVIDCAKLCLKYNIAVIFPFIIGFPGESDRSVRITLTLIKKLKSIHSKFEMPVFYFKPYPGSRISQEMVNQGFDLPQTTKEWSNFDFIGSSGPLVSDDKYQMVENFKFYNRIAWAQKSWIYWPLQKIARWRCENDYYKMPVEKLIVERLRPQPKLS
jgi:anaerobic magnesium-protoporphyrin IX monomethyl ester cyclase